MSFAEWSAQNWIALAGAITGIAGLLFNGLSLRSETRTRRITNLLAITRSHRELWSLLIAEPGLKRLLVPDPKAQERPVSTEEELFVLFAIHHLNSVFRAMSDGLVPRPEAIRRDVWWFFSLPIPATIWERFKPLQDEAFVRFVESCRNWK